MPSNLSRAATTCFLPHIGLCLGQQRPALILWRSVTLSNGTILCSYCKARRPPWALI